MVRGLPKFPFSNTICTECIKGKQHRDPIPKKSTWRAAQKLELVHSDICGPINPTSNSNKRYLLVFIDDFSRKAWVYFLVEKSEAFDCFKRFKAMVEKQTGLCVKGLRTDRGGEFCSNEFNNFCSQNGIKRQMTTAYTPQQNGVAERKNRTVMNMVRSLLADKNIPRVFWAEAANWAVYVLNRCPTLAVKEMTPEECWSGIKPSVDHFRVFGCKAHVHVPEERRTKLDNRSTTCVLLGISDESKGYRLFDPTAKKIIVSRDVIFEEEEQWKRGENSGSCSARELEWGDEIEEEESSNREIEAREVEPNDSREVEIEEREMEPRGMGEGTQLGDDQFQTNDQIEVGEGGIETVDSEEEEESYVELKNTRPRQPPAWLRDYVSGEVLYEDDELNMALAVSTDPWFYEEAVRDSNWKTAMDREIEAIEKNDTWTLMKLPAGAEKIGAKWVYKTKYNENGKIDKYTVGGQGVFSKIWSRLH